MDLEAEGKLPAEQAAEARAPYDDLLAEYGRAGSRESAEALGSAAVLETLERQVTLKGFPRRPHDQNGARIA